MFDATTSILSEVPTNLSKFPKLSYIYMSNNQIHSIPSGAFQSSSSKHFVSVFLSNNRIWSIAPGAFQYPSAEKIILDLSNNELSTIPAGVFEGNVP